jgi:hypothetical protein
MVYEITNTSEKDYYEFTVRKPSNGFVFSVKHYENGIQILIENNENLITLPADSAEILSEVLYRLMSEVKKPYYLTKFKDDLDIALNDFWVKLMDNGKLSDEVILEKYKTACNLIKEVRDRMGA